MAAGVGIWGLDEGARECCKAEGCGYGDWMKGLGSAARRGGVDMGTVNGGGGVNGGLHERARKCCKAGV